MNSVWCIHAGVMTVSNNNLDTPSNALLQNLKTYLNEYTGQFVVVTLPPLVSNVNALVPTINKSSYNSVDGSINTVIAPKWEMRGDTMTVVVRYNNIIKTERIILK